MAVAINATGWGCTMSGPPPAVPHVDASTTPKGPRKSLSSFDEQLWPIYVAILVLAAFLCSVASVGSFQASQPWRHPLVGFAGVALTTVLLIWCDVFLPVELLHAGIADQPVGPCDSSSPWPF